MNSTPSTLARIMRLTALHPPPPTPITLIFAPVRFSSLNEIRIPVSFAIFVPPQKSARPPPARSASCSDEHAFDFRYEIGRPLRSLAPGSRAIEQQTNYRSVLGLGKFLRHPFQAARIRQTHGQIEHALGQLDQAFQVRSTAA